MIKKIIGLCIALLVFSCKDEAKQNTNEPEEIQESVKVETKETVLSEVLVPDISTWFKNGLSIEESTENYNGENVVLISRLDPRQPSYSGIDNLKIQYGSTYKISAVVKKADVGKDFAMRIQGVYPNRVDAIFDLEKGTTKDTMISGDGSLAENSKATIEELSDGWYKCSLYADVFAEYMRVVIGPTSGNLNISLWETKTGKKNNVFFAPSMLKVLEM